MTNINNFWIILGNFWPIKYQLLIFDTPLSFFLSTFFPITTYTILFRPIWLAKYKKFSVFRSFSCISRKKIVPLRRQKVRLCSINLSANLDRLKFCFISLASLQSLSFLESFWIILDKILVYLKKKVVPLPRICKDVSILYCNRQMKQYKAIFLDWVARVLY